eukprot:CAMPEP_0197036042 /NCGR_PEP_ID=MMETSP1384-20130603/13661_1 /TAXON_ID=29189 /ORGANISM="Ammonia sp." /LENGTH=175 /DNA_ID=CAMNT_0042466169 /DNA_START=243 /DNA_END=770 /DNA_ORIENTATION=+
MKEKYQNYLSFWAILAIILGLEYVTFGLFYRLAIYRVLRLIFVIWLQIDYCVYAKSTFEKLTPFISKHHEQKIEDLLGEIIATLSKQGEKVKEKASNQFWQLITQNYEIVKDSVFSALSTASQKAVDLSKTNSNASLSNQKPPGESNEPLNDDEKEKENDNAADSAKQAIQKKDS